MLCELRQCKMEHGCWWGEEAYKQYIFKNNHANMLKSVGISYPNVDAKEYVIGFFIISISEKFASNNVNRTTICECQVQVGKDFNPYSLYLCSEGPLPVRGTPKLGVGLQGENWVWA